MARNIGFTAKELKEIRSLIETHQAKLMGHGMGILAPSADERVKNVEVTDELISVSLMDGRTISAPLVWFPRLLKASAADRQKWETCAAGYGIHWEALDEDLSTEGLLRGTPSFEYVGH